MKKSWVGCLGVGMLFLGLETGWADSTPVQMEEIVVTATRTREEIKSVPNAVTVIGPREIAASSARNVGELLSGALAVEVDGYGPLGSTQSASIRGSSTSQVLVMVDGRPTNSITYGSADLSQFPIEGVERVEIVKGPTSYLYGANALGGVINIITKDPPAKPSLQAGLSYGSFNTQTYRAEHGQTLDRFGYLFTGAYKTSDGFRDNSAYDGKDFSSKLSFQPLDRLSLSLLTTVHQDGLGVPGPKPQAGTIPLFGNSQVTSLYDHQDDRLFNNNLKMNWQTSELLQLSGQVYQDWSELQYRQRYAVLTSSYEEHDTYRANIWGGNLLSHWSLPYQNKLTLGVDYRREDLEGETKTTTLGTGLTVPSQWKPDNTLWGLFAQEQWQALPVLRVSGGVRYDNTSRYGSETSPDLGLVYSPFNETQIKGHYGKAFRAPTFNDLFWPGSGNSNLKPENGTSYEITWDQGLKDQKAALTLGGFRWEVTDGIVWVPDATGNWQPQNVNQQNTWGGELGFKWNPSREWSLSVGYTYLDSTQKNSEVQDALTNTTATVERRAASVPRHRVRLTLGTELPWGTKAYLTGRYVGDRVFYYSDYTDFPQVTQKEKTVAAYYTLDLKLSHLFARHWKATLSLLNLTNQSYDAQPGTSFLDQNYQAPGISVTTGLTYNF